MAFVAAPQNRNGFQLAIVCAVPIEAESVLAMFDNCWENEGLHYGRIEGDKNVYTTGRIGGHNVVLVLLPGMGGIPAARTAAGLAASFPNIELVLIVGVCGAAPVHPQTKEEIHLGDVILSTGGTRYNFGTLYPGLFKAKESVQQDPMGAPAKVQNLLKTLATNQNRQRLQHSVFNLVNSVKFQDAEPTAGYPGSAHDKLYEASYHHQHRAHASCCAYQHGAQAASSLDCHKLGCDPARLVTRRRHHLRDENPNIYHNEGPVIHFGRYGSANVVLKSGTHRDELTMREGLVAFEMEGAGMWDYYPTIIIKAACDYADSHKNKLWQPYGAMMAAACVKIVLEQWYVAGDMLPHAHSVAV